MAIEFFSANRGDPMSPRISFSYDFCHSNAIPVEQHQYRSNSSGLNNPSFEFDFCVRENFDQESSSADELFSYGILLPSEIKKNKNKNFPPKQIDHQFLLPPLHKSLRTEAIQENASTTMKVSKPERIKEEADVEKQGHNHKSFWRFKSKSCGTGYGRSLCPLPILSRSFSSGSSTSPSTSSSVKKNMSVSKEGKNYYNNNTQKSHVSARSSSSSMGHSNSYLKFPLKKSQAYGNDIPVILNVPSANLFGFGSIFSRSKHKTKRKY
ncbi:hypothetical protein K1719_032509 [Acacia pycnantha]|nr:hypothetical protein K1719_032509 [Acacia pycnantha]